MSIYATLHVFSIRCFGQDAFHEIVVQAVPAHIDNTDPAYGFLPPPVDPEGMTPRAVYFVDSTDKKGTERSHQEYATFLLMLTGKQYEQIGFSKLMQSLKKRSASDTGLSQNTRSLRR